MHPRLKPSLARCCRTLIALVAASSAVMTAPIFGQKVERSVPLSAAAWTLDLRNYGYGRASELVDGHTNQTFRAEMFHSDVYFLSDGDIEETFYAFEPLEGQPKARVLYTSKN